MVNLDDSQRAKHIPFAILAAQGSAIERTLHSTISELVKIKSDWHWRWSQKG